MPVKEVLMGNHATSHGVRLARAQVISAYPITPQTQIVEELSEMCADGRLGASFIKVESEHSAMACLIGASQAGVRTFTATSAQGLALMHELLFWAAYARLPIVLTDVNRAMAPGWSIWSDQTDSLAQRDTGWVQIYCETNQEVLDTTIMAFKLAEEVELPVMVVYDAFILSHTYEAVEIPDQVDVDKFLPPRRAEFVLDPKKPLTFSALTGPENYMEFRYIMEEAHGKVRGAYKNIAKDYARRFKRMHDIVETYRTEDAEIVLVTSGSMTSTARVAVDTLREKGEQVGLLKLRMFRPFPADEVRAAIANVDGRTVVKKLAVMDRNISHGAGGIWAQELRSVLCGQPRSPEVHGFLVGLGGRDITVDTITEVYQAAKNQERTGTEPVWVGLKR
jgi:pyruvate/2-oxoacid:ferredoxin oxidoreductase alpha subunit